jgi:integrase
VSTITVPEAAALLRVSTSWVYRHLASLPVSRRGRLVRFDEDQLRATLLDGKSLQPKRGVMPSRSQLGSLKLRGSTWYGIYRVETGTGKRSQKWVRLGTRRDFPNKADAKAKLISTMTQKPIVEPTQMSFTALVEKWKAAEGPSLTVPTLRNYSNTLKSWVTPTFGNRGITSITRDDIQLFLNSQAAAYSRSSIKSMRLVLQIVLGYGHLSGWITTYPCTRLKTPKVTNTKRCVTRVHIDIDTTTAMAAKLREPYCTLVLLLRKSGLRIEEGSAIKLTDLNGHVLRIQRVMYNGKAYDLEPKEQRDIPVMDASLLERMKALGRGHEWMFRSAAGTPINPGNALKRYVRPAAEACGIEIGGYHDFRHSWITSLRQQGVHPKVISTLAGHSKVQIAMDTYDHPDLQDLEQGMLGTGLLASVSNFTSVQ